MTTYPSPLSPSLALTDEATLEVAVDCLLEHVPIEMLSITHKCVEVLQRVDLRHQV